MSFLGLGKSWDEDFEEDELERPAETNPLGDDAPEPDEENDDSQTNSREESDLPGGSGENVIDFREGHFWFDKKNTAGILADLGNIGKINCMTKSRRSI